MDYKLSLFAVRCPPKSAGTLLFILFGSTLSFWASVLCHSERQRRIWCSKPSPSPEWYSGSFADAQDDNALSSDPSLRLAASSMLTIERLCALFRIPSPLLMQCLYPGAGRPQSTSGLKRHLLRSLLLRNRRTLLHRRIRLHRSLLRIRLYAFRLRTCCL